MKKMQQDRANIEANPYAKIVDDANRKLRQLGDFDYLKDLPKNHDRRYAPIPFPYGGKRVSSLDRLKELNQQHTEEPHIPVAFGGKRISDYRNY